MENKHCKSKAVGNFTNERVEFIYVRVFFLF